MYIVQLKEGIVLTNLKIVVTYFHNLQISRFISNPFKIRINDAFQMNVQKRQSWF